MDIYENFVIGDFLFGLGVEMAFHYRDRPMPRTLVNLFQQTPLDQTFADVIVKNPGILLILEFKRETNRSEKENAKLWMLKKGLRSKSFTPSEAKELKRISRKIHWFVEIPKGFSTTSVSAVPYLDLRTRSSRIELADFVRRTAEEASASSLTDEDMRRYEWYLRVLATCRGSESPTSNTSQSSGALLILISNGRVHYEAVNDIREVLIRKEAIITELVAQREMYAIREELRMEKIYEQTIGERHELSQSQKLIREYGYSIRR